MSPWQQCAPPPPHTLPIHTTHHHPSRATERAPLLIPLPPLPPSLYAVDDRCNHRAFDTAHSPTASPSFNTVHSSIASPYGHNTAPRLAVRRAHARIATRRPILCYPCSHTHCRGRPPLSLALTPPTVPGALSPLTACDSRHHSVQARVRHASYTHPGPKLINRGMRSLFVVYFVRAYAPVST